jgi:small subunit ribosomal protein S17
MSEATQSEKKTRQRKRRQGIVVSDKMEKTIVVQIDEKVMHPVYKKYVRKRVKYKAHDETNTARMGDTVQIEECRPLSREKRWRLKNIIERAPVL